PWEPRELRLIVRRGLERYEAEAERRQLIGALERSVERARRAAEQKGRLLAVAAHELGAPLHVLANAPTPMRGGARPTPACSWLETARRSAEWLGRGLAHMTTAARWREGRLALHRRPIEVASLLEDVQTTFAPIIADRRMTLQVESASEMPL